MLKKNMFIAWACYRNVVHSSRREKMLQRGPCTLLEEEDDLLYWLTARTFKMTGPRSVVV